MAHSDQLCKDCSDNQGRLFWVLPDRELGWLFTALKAPHLLLGLKQDHCAKSPELTAQFLEEKANGEETQGRWGGENTGAVILQVPPKAAGEGLWERRRRTAGTWRQS